MLDSLNTDVLVTGHTHIPLCVSVDKGVLVNPGSLYRFGYTTRPSSHSYGVLHVPEMGFELFDVEQSPSTSIPCET